MSEAQLVRRVTNDLHVTCTSLERVSLEQCPLIKCPFVHGKIRALHDSCVLVFVLP